MHIYVQRQTLESDWNVLIMNFLMNLVGLHFVSIWVYFRDF